MAVVGLAVVIPVGLGLDVDLAIGAGLAAERLLFIYVLFAAFRRIELS